MCCTHVNDANDRCIFVHVCIQEFLTDSDSIDYGLLFILQIVFSAYFCIDFTFILLSTYWTHRCISTAACVPSVTTETTTRKM